MSIAIGEDEMHLLKTADDLIRYTGDPNVMREGRYPIHYAAENIHDNHKVVKFLCNSRADVNRKDGTGTPALHYAVKKGNLNIAEELLRWSADVNINDDAGRSLLQYAVKILNLKLVKWLIEKHADLKYKDKYGRTILHIAVSEPNPHHSPSDDKKRSNIVKLLLRNYADVNACSLSNETPLMCAVSKHINFAVVRHLLKARADVHKRDLNERTCLHYLVSNQTWDSKVTMELIKAGVSIYAKDKDGNDAISLIVNSMFHGLKEYEDMIRIVTLRYYPELMDFSNDVIKVPSQFAEDCYEEVKILETVFILDTRMSLRDFILRGRDLDGEVRVLNFVFDTLMERTFVKYCDCIVDQFPKFYLRNKLCEMGLYARRGLVDIKYHENFICTACDYLSSQDILNLILVRQNSLPAHLSN